MLVGPNFHYPSSGQFDSVLLWLLISFVCSNFIYIPFIPHSVNSSLQIRMVKCAQMMLSRCPPYSPVTIRAGGGSWGTLPPVQALPQRTLPKASCFLTDTPANLGTKPLRKYKGLTAVDCTHPIPVFYSECPLNVDLRGFALLTLFEHGFR